ncbi:MAG: zinc-ribbon domain-containing protein [Gemmatimonadales bacterium]|nr:zinc-ribbon domain-containing protein [Gemmatimonadales bacterium]
MTSPASPPSSPALFCAACGTQLTPGAKFCHRCGAATAAAGSGTGRERTAWIIAGAMGLLALLAVAWRAGTVQPTVPDMGNAGNVGASGASPLAGRAPDISNLTPRERFDRLWERIIRAAEGGDSTTIIQFTPMALGAYAQLDTVDADARYHAAMIRLTIGDFASAEALADTILRQAPGHLFGFVIRGESADRQNQTPALNQSYRDFLAHYDAELRAGRPEYADHTPIIADFRTRAKATLGQ